MMSDAGQVSELDVSITPELSTFVRLVGLRVTDFSVVARESLLDEPLAEAATELRATYGHDDVTMAVRGLYRKLGIDPTKRRPSSEALLRRIRRGDPLPRVNALVDVCNWCSVESRLPFGLYDAGRINGAIECRRGRQGEAYSGIRKDDVHVDDRLVLSDQLGAFGNPSSDSARTMITSSTTSAMVVVFAPLAVDSNLVAATVDTVTARVAQFIVPRAIMSWAARKQIEAK
jgi:DNA/RNA-binding domain of Phe-tRNA-synthetase-like protein